MTRVEPWWQETSVRGHTATWADGLRVSRLAHHRKQLWIEIEYAGAVHEVRLGPRTFRSADRRLRKGVNA